MRRIALAVLVFSSAFHSAARAADPPKDPDAVQLKRFIDALQILNQNAADPVNIDQEFYQGAVPGMLRHLDPHSVFFDPGQFNQLREMETSTHKGFGSIVSVLPGRVVVLQVLPGTPSDKAGLGPGDEILAVNNYRLDRLDPDQIIELLTESKQKPVQLVVRTPGNVRLQELTLTPEEMKSSTVERAFLLKPGVGYIRVTEFDDKTGSQIHDAIESLGGRSLQGLVIDLRNNPGGFVNAAIATASFFLKPGQLIVSTRGRNVAETNEKVPGDNIPYQFPLSVIVNAKTASASEIVSGALQDHDRATIVGEPSFGKGLVQSVYPLSENTGLALTTALYYIPSGRSIQKPFAAQRDGLNEDFTLGATATHPNERNDFKTDGGRPVPGGGGIVPDFVTVPAGQSRLQAVLEGSGAFTSFAAEYVRGKQIAADWQVPPQALDQFRTWLSERSIEPSLAEWLEIRTYLETRLKAEVYNLTLGVAKGDEVEAQLDTQIQKALDVLNAPPPAAK